MRIVVALGVCTPQGQPRAPFDQLLTALLPAAAPPPVVSVDIPSGWQASEAEQNTPVPNPPVSTSHWSTGRHHTLTLTLPATSPP